MKLKMLKAYIEFCKVNEFIPTLEGVEKFNQFHKKRKDTPCGSIQSK